MRPAKTVGHFQEGERLCLSCLMWAFIPDYPSQVSCPVCRGVVINAKDVKLRIEPKRIQKGVYENKHYARAVCCHNSQNYTFYFHKSTFHDEAVPLAKKCVDEMMRARAEGRILEENKKWEEFVISEKKKAGNFKEVKTITYKGETKTLREWAEVSEIEGLTRGTIRTRLDKGMTVEEALTTPVRVKKKRGE